MNRTHVITYLLSAALALGAVTGAFALTQPVNTTPARASLLLAGFEGPNGLNGWKSDPGMTGGNDASISTDPMTVSQGTQSLKLDTTNFGTSGSTNNGLEYDPAMPLDLSGYHAISMDVYAPADSLIPSGSWYQPNLRITDSQGTVYYGNRDIHAGWNHVSWELAQGRGTGVTKLYFTFYYNSSALFQGPIYIDNIVALKDSLIGVHPDETLLDGFDDPAANANIVTKSPATAAIDTTDKQFIESGAGSLKVDYTGIQNWGQDVVRVPVTPVDLSKAIALRVDVYAPKSSLPTDWWQVSVGLHADMGTVYTDTYTLLTDQWDVIEIPLDPTMAASLASPTMLTFGTGSNSDMPFAGPIYFDNLRAVIPSTVVPGDVTGDGKVTVADATLALRLAIGLQMPTPAQLQAGDLLHTGKITIADATVILRKAIGLG